jgi:hypothetical protein
MRFLGLLAEMSLITAPISIIVHLPFSRFFFVTLAATMQAQLFKYGVLKIMNKI